MWGLPSLLAPYIVSIGRLSSRLGFILNFIFLDCLARLFRSSIRVDKVAENVVQGHVQYSKAFEHL